MSEAIELLTDRDKRPRSLMAHLFIPMSCAGIAFVAVCYVNYMGRRPIWSGIQRHILIPPIAGFLGKVLDNYRDDYYAERDAVFRHYISLHPEDFQMPERKKFSEVFLPWHPIR